MTAILPGKNGTAPMSSECEPHLDRMAQALMIGANLEPYVLFDRDGQPLQIANASE